MFVSIAGSKPTAFPAYALSVPHRDSPGACVYLGTGVDTSIDTARTSARATIC
jgi:hypothetical protein